MTDKLSQLDKGNDANLARLRGELETLTKTKEWTKAQAAIDAAGVLDPTPTCDAVSAVMSLVAGDYVGAGLSVVSMIPYVGDAAAKTAKAVKLTEKLTSLAKSIEGVSKELADATQKAIANRKAAAEAAREARAKAANACKKCNGADKYGSQLPTRGTWEPPHTPGNGKWTSDPPDKYVVEYKNGYPDFTTATKNGEKIVVESVEIPAMSGKKKDMTAARDAMRLKEGKPDWPGNGKNEPDGYVWHHKEDGATMELLPTTLHNRSMGTDGSGAAHTGGASIVKDKVF